jgi:hypothetical protein
MGGASRWAALIVLVLVLCVLLAFALAARFGRARAPWAGAAAWLGGARKGAAAPSPVSRGEEADRAAPSMASRGEEVDRAEVPAALLEAGLPPGFGWAAFDLRDGRVVPARLGEGLFFGISGRDDPARSSLLTPRILARAAHFTSGRVYAWYVLDSPEACVAVKAEPRGGFTLELDPDDLVEWLRPRLKGEPPHKIELDEYLAHLRELGLTVQVGARRYPEARFDLIDMTTAAEREKATRSLLALDAAAFEALDWAQYDEAAGRAACRAPKEAAGDVVVDLLRRAVAAPKVRYGRPYTTHAHMRSYVTFHTHPSARHEGGRYEPPSEGDLGYVLWACAHHAVVWHFVSAPEGTYILRPSQLLIEYFYRSPRDALAAAAKVYRDHVECAGGVLACARRTAEALRNAGFVAYFREAPCLPVADRPDLVPVYNLLDRQEYQAALDALRATPGPVLLAADWSRAVEACLLPTVRESAWLRARYAGGAVLPGDSHAFGDPADVRSYPGGPGPLMVFFFADEEFPPRIPPAAIEAARENAEVWPWLAFLSPKRVLVFRADAEGLESHGPRALP